MEPKITLYEHSDFKGRSKTFTQSSSNLYNDGFNDVMSSLKVERGVWVLFEHKDYKGNIYVAVEGDEFESVDWHDKASSIKLIENDDFFETPSCTLYEHDRFRGKSLHLTENANDLNWYKFNDTVSSIKVHSGAWIAYTDNSFKGRQSLYLQGNHSKSASEGPFPNDKISSMRAISLKQSDPIVVEKISFNISAAFISAKPSVVFEWRQINDSSIEQKVQITQNKSVSKEDTYEFHWNQGASISASYETKTGIPVLGQGTLTVSAEAFYDIGSNSGTKTAKTETWGIEFPSVIPARTQIVLSSVLTEGRFDVPFTTVLSQGKKTWTENGTFKGVTYYGFVTEFKEEKL